MNDEKDNQNNLILQIRQKEQESAEKLEKTEQENNKKITETSEIAERLIAEVEQKTKDVGQVRFQEAKGKGKEEYKRILVESDNKRRDEVEGGKVNLPKAKEHIQKNFMSIFGS